MKFLAILFALLIERGYPEIARWRQVEHFHDYAAWFRSYFTQPWLLGRGGLLALLVPVLLAVWVLRTLLAPIGLLVDLVVLVLCLGPRDLFADLRALREGGGGGRAVPVEAVAGLSLDIDDYRGARFVAPVVGAALRRLFSVVFWFILLGPVGAVLYRAVAELDDRREDLDTDFNAAVWQTQCLLEWIPARLLAATAAVVGHYDGAAAAWRSTPHRDLFDDARRLAADVVSGAMDLDTLGEEPARMAGKLWDFVLRAGIVWVTVLALLTLAGLLY